MQKNEGFRKTLNVINDLMISDRNTDGIDEVAVEPTDPTNPEGDQVVKVFYSAPEAPYPPACADYIARQLVAMKVTDVRVEYIQGSSIELY
jgi:hypothetical protein